MTYDFGEFTVTSWGGNENGDYQWRARWGDITTEFVAERTAPIEELREQGLSALRTVIYGSPAGPG